MSTVTELKSKREVIRLETEGLVSALERDTNRHTSPLGNRGNLNPLRRAEIEANQQAMAKLDNEIQEAERKQTVPDTHVSVERVKATLREHRPTGPARFQNGRETIIKSKLSPAYLEAFGNYLSSQGTRMEASLTEAASISGGYAVPIETDGEIVPLAPTDCALRRLATVRKTDRDLLIPQFATFGTLLSSIVTEGSTFPENDPTLGQFKLSAFMVGSQRNISFELAQDRKVIVEEVVESDCAADQLMYEEQLYISGTGSGQPQGLIGNVGSGVTEEPDGAGNLVSIAGIQALIASLKSAYLSNASFLMSRATGLIIRTAQLVGGSGTTAYVPAWTRENGQDFLFGYPVQFSDAMPAAARGATPVLFGDFRRGYIIGDRGGSALFVKILDQASMLQSGEITVVAYRRTDGRVRRSEAIQQYNIASS